MRERERERKNRYLNSRQSSLVDQLGLLPIARVRLVGVCAEPLEEHFGSVLRKRRAALALLLEWFEDRLQHFGHAVASGSVRE